MNVLGIEYSSAQRSVAVAVTDNGGKVIACAEAVETGGRAANTFRMVNETLREAGVEREQVDCIAVGLGPGSYTGIRSAISFAQGWELAGKVQVIGLPSSEVMATEAVSIGLTGLAGVVIDAQRGEFYVAVYRLAPSSERSPDSLSNIETVAALRIATLDEVLKLQGDGCQLFGSEPLKGLPDLRIVPVRALTLARLAMRTQLFTSAESLAPVYLRQTTFVKAPTPRHVG